MGSCFMASLCVVVGVGIGSSLGLYVQGLSEFWNLRLGVGNTKRRIGSLNKYRAAVGSC